jgi:hypothetical protein
VTITVTDGKTAPTSDGRDFVYQGEQNLAIASGGAPPRASIEAPSAVECDSPDGGLVMLDGSGSMDPEFQGGIDTYMWFSKFGSPGQQTLGSGPRIAVRLPLGQTRISLQVTDNDGLEGVAESVVVVTDSTPPTLICPALDANECAGPAGADVVVVAGATDTCSRTIAISNDRTSTQGDASGAYPLGTTFVNYHAVDEAGNRSSCTVPIVVQDTLPPRLSVSTDPSTLWPANHEMVPVHVRWEAQDLCTPNPRVELISATSSEPNDAPGMWDGDTKDDILGADLGTADALVDLRAERAGTGRGRVYELTYKAADASGNTAPALAVVTVPHDQGQGPEPLQRQGW